MAERTWRRVLNDEAGLSLVEVMVTLIVFGIATSMVFKALLGVQDYSSKVQGSSEANFQARQAVAEIDRQVRSGNVLYSPANETSPSTCTPSGTDAGSCMRVYTQANGVERCVQWQVVADSAHPGTSILRSRSWSPHWQTDGQFTGWTVQARGLRSAASQAPFALAGASTSQSSRFLNVRFEVVDPRRPAMPVVLTSSLAGRNTNYGYDGGLCNPAPTS